jgi:transposase InsO family protein
VNRGLRAECTGEAWVVDFTFVATRAGTAYTALVTDAFARLIPGGLPPRATTPAWCWTR